MASTITEKILSRLAGRPVRAGDELRVTPDFVLAYAAVGYAEMYLETIKKEFGVEQLPDPQRYAIFIDHNIPATTEKNEKMHQATREWCLKQGVALYERQGIGHLVAAEVGYGTPGAFAVHFDGHVTQLGALGTLAMGIRFNILEAFVRPDIPIKVPATTRIEFSGKLGPGVMARDVFHHIVGKLGAGACRNTIMELGGESLSEFSIGDLQGITGLAMFTGAVGAIVNPTPEALAYALPRAKIKIDPVWSDADATYAAVHHIDLNGVEPVLVVPPSPADTRPLKDFLGLHIDVGYIGSCASGRIEDLRAAAQVLKGRRVKPGFQLNVVPSSNEIMLQATQEGLLATLMQAGAFISSPTCSFCYGALGGMLAGQRALSTGTLNVRGRMGSVDSEIYIGSAASVAAAAIDGAVADPRAFF
ncbi:MAG TPA: aconitase family protein [Ramlibacter sp.]|uniref:3-isopropylmalate dehydratase large subunit n=1 Tax=Ramlibacter sp. TaxID=1917967 RepID=UPI002C0BC0E8|nr:aconitase family protein [Ramlibacter sp.]HVZ45225.1 aconitase family protein [Ramlibacter sp.]